MLFQRAQNKSASYWESGEMQLAFHSGAISLTANITNGMEALRWSTTNPWAAPGKGLFCERVTIPIGNSECLHYTILYCCDSVGVEG